MKEAFGLNDENEASTIMSDPDDKKLFEEDRLYFSAADLVDFIVGINLSL